MESLNKLFLPELTFNNKKVIYTESAKEKLKNLHVSLDERFEDYFQNEKYVPGDDFIEITASDVLILESRIRIAKERKTTNYSARLLLQLYFILGVLALIVGLYYEKFQAIISGDKDRIILIASGAMLIIVSSLLNYYVRLKEKREDEMVVRKRDIDIKKVEKFLRSDEEIE